LLDCDALAVDGDEDDVLEEADEVGLRGLLESQNGARLETQFGPEVPGDLPDQTPERSPVKFNLDK
jgi:hypothetical protein